MKNNRPAGRTGYGSKKQATRDFPPDVAIAWRGPYEDKEGNEKTYLKVIAKEDILAGTELIAFPVKRTKKNETDPDFGFRLSESRKKTSSARTNTSLDSSDDAAADDDSDVDF